MDRRRGPGRVSRDRALAAVKVRSLDSRPRWEAWTVWILSLVAAVGVCATAAYTMYQAIKAKPGPWPPGGRRRRDPEQDEDQAEAVV